VALIVVGDPRVVVLRDWWTPERLRRVVEAMQEALRTREEYAAQYGVSLKLGISVRMLTRYLSGESKPCDRTLVFIDAGIKRVLGNDWLKEFGNAP